MTPVAQTELERPEAQEPAILRPGMELAPGYQVIDHLSRGEDLDVYEVWSEDRACRCAAKLLRPDLRESERCRTDLLDEGRLLSAFTHPHIVRAYEVIEEPHPIVILELLTGETVSYMIRRRTRRLAAVELAFLGLHLCSATSYLHRHGLLHLDLKPSNIVSDRGLAKVLDLSLAAPPGMQRAGTGTRPYMAPEQARGGYVDAAADVWGIGVVLYKAACGEGPFDVEVGSDRFLQLERRADPIRRHRRLPGAFAAVVDACLEPEPRDRPELDDLTETLETVVPLAPRG